jgi:phage-related protein
MKSNDDGATFKLEKNKKKDDSSYGLKAASVSYPTKTKTRRTSQPSAKEQQFAQAIQSLAETVKDLSPVGLGKVLAAAMLITSNTVGASMMVLPGLASGPGLVVSTGLLSGMSLCFHTIATVIILVDYLSY